MSYLVLARKYRPQKFEDLIGQSHVSTLLKNALSQGRASHAYLFTGDRGLGKTSTARILAKALMCEARQKDPSLGEPCGLCGQCKSVTNGKHVDVIEIDGASNNSIEDVRMLRERIQYAPASGPAKVYIIDEVHMLSGGAFNALLKTLEEPPEVVTFILATTEVNKIPDTIRSRCQRIDFRRVDSETVANHLTQMAQSENITLETEAAMLLARLSEGSLRDAISLFDQVSSQGNVLSETNISELLGVPPIELILSCFEAMGARNALEAIKKVKKAEKSGFDYKRFAIELLSLAKNLMFLQAGLPSQELDLPKKYLSRAEKLATTIRKASLDRIVLILEQCLELLGRWTTPQMGLELALLKITRLKQREVMLEELYESLSKKPNEEEVQKKKIIHPLENQNELYEKQWNELLTKIQGRDLGLGTFLKGGKPGGIKSNIFQIEFSEKKSFDYCNTPERLRIIKEEVGSYFSSEYQIQLHIKKDESLSLAAPITEQVLSVFGGKIVKP